VFDSFLVFIIDLGFRDYSLSRVSARSGQDHIRPIQDISRNRPCFQFDPSELCNEIPGSQWKKEFRKIIAEWMR